MKAYLDQLVLKQEKPCQSMEALVTQLGELEAGPRELVVIHTAALKQLVKDAPPAKARAYAIDGRLLALEMMGYLVNFYRPKPG